ncbi:MAG: TM2 domain-containing protein [Gemmatimonadales bacterium]|nr:TM2 domain-containing protein [Gemmatimonadales bacterium]
MTDQDLFPSPKSRLTTIVLAAILGIVGAHRFYVGRTRSAILMPLTIGGLGLWYLYDLIMIASGSFRDAEGRLVTNWDTEDEHLAGALPAGAVLDELDALRLDVNDLHERLAFTERLLGNRTHGPPPSP